MGPDNNAQTRPLPVDYDDIAGILAARRDLGPDSEMAVIAAFLDRTSQAIDARVDQRLAQYRLAAPVAPMAPVAPAPDPAARRDGRPSLALPLGSIALGLPLTGVAASFQGFAGVVVALLVWIAIAVINVVYTTSRR